jgi:hypothetical protein
MFEVIEKCHQMIYELILGDCQHVKRKEVVFETYEIHTESLGLLRTLSIVRNSKYSN